MAKVYIDTETYGLSGPPCQVAVVAEDGKVLLNILVDWGMPMPPAAQAVHGISAERLAKEGIKPPVAAKMLLAALTGVEEVWAHNVEFDHKMVLQLMGKVSLPLLTWRCTWKLAQSKFGKGGNKLEQLAAKFQIKAGGHDALGDAECCRKVHQHLECKADVNPPVGFANQAVAKEPPTCKPDDPISMGWMGPYMIWKAPYQKNDRVLGPVCQMRTFWVSHMDKDGYLVVKDYDRQDIRNLRPDRFGTAEAASFIIFKTVI